MARLLKLNVLCFRGAFVVGLIWLVLIHRFRSVPKSMKKIPGIVYMLQWTSPYTEPFAFLEKGFETFVRRNCTVMNCYVTSNREILGGITQFNAVLFHGKEIIERNNLSMPEQRSSDQIYVFGSMESSGYYPVSGKQLDGFFNLTWTYKLDSDIYFGYIAIRNKRGKSIGPKEVMHWMSNEEMLPITDALKQKVANKKTAAAWFVSNCRAPSKRHKVVEEIKLEMEKYDLSVDVYGSCGDKRCPRETMQDCFKLIETDYYFYFAFENSLAEDYVTEKLLIGLNHYAVPVVFGGANYSRFMPDGAYLNALKLGTEELVKQMFEIIDDTDRYNDFFKWHNHYSYHDLTESPDTDPFCNLCDYINRMESIKKTNVIDYFKDWWNPQVVQWTSNH